MVHTRSPAGGKTRLQAPPLNRLMARSVLAYMLPSCAAQSAFTGAPGLVWDGRDAAGSLVPPGLYLIRVSAQLGRGDETVMRTIAVIY